MQDFEARFGGWVIKFRWLIIIFSLALVGLAAYGGKNLAFSTNYRVFFGADNPQLLAFDALENQYTKNDNVMFVITPKDGKVFTPKTLSAVETLTKDAWQIPFALRVDSISNFQHTKAVGDELVVRDLVENAPDLKQAELDRIRKVALNEPLLIHRLVNEDATVTGVNVTVQLPGKDETREVPQVVKAAREMAEQLRKAHPEIEVRLTGMVFMNNAFAEASQKDMKSLVLLSFLVMMVFLALLLRDFQHGIPALLGVFAALAGIGLVLANLALPVWLVVSLIATGVGILFWALPGTMVTVLVIFFSILAGMGLGGYVGFPLTPPSASAPTIILTVAIANSVHVLITFLHAMHEGHSKQEAVVESLRVNLQPVFLTSVTTAIGFLSMNFSEVPPFRHLGNFVAFGVLASFVLAVGFLPAMMSLLPLKMRKIGQDRDPIMEGLGHFVVRYRSQLLWGMGILTIALVMFIPRNELNDVFVEYFDDSVQFRRDADYTSEHLTGIYTADYSLPSGESGGISEPEYLREVEAFANWYRQQPETLHVNVITDIMKRLNKNMHGDDPAWYKLPDKRDLSAQYLLLYELSLPYGLDLNNQINVDKSATRMTATLKSISSNELLGLQKRAEQWLQKNTRIITDAHASGPSMMFAHIGKRNIISMLIGTSVALVLISMILIFALRSFKIGLVSMIPNLIPAAMAFGVWGMLVGEIGLALSIVTGMTLGIVVDDTVHFLSKYLRARRERNYSAQDAVVYAFRSVGRALLTTSIVLVAGFLVLSTSSFELNAGMGLLTAIVIAFAIAADFLLLPPLLMKLEEKTDEKMESDPDAVPATHTATS